MKLLLGITVLVCFLGTALSQTQCYGDDGRAVDWWVILKLPKDSSSTDARLQAGEAYIYISSADTSATNFAMSTRLLSNPTSALGRTIAQYFQNRKSASFGHLVYNDQTPDQTSSYYAHAKGIVGFTDKGGFWIVHSMPRFPDVSLSAFDLPDSGVIYGQHYMCLSLPPSSLDTVGQQLQYYNPLVYSSSMPAALASKYPRLAAMISGDRLTASPASSFQQLTTVGGVNLLHFAKNAKWNKDLYGSFVGPSLKTSLFVESWMRPFEDSLYPPAVSYEVVNTYTLKFVDGSKSYAWNRNQDHSKWAISIFPSNSIVCLGDINKQMSQYKRGGGTVCQVNPALHQMFSKLIVVDQNMEKFVAATGSNKLYPSSTPSVGAMNITDMSEGANIVPAPDVDPTIVTNPTSTPQSGAVQAQLGWLAMFLGLFIVLF